MGAVPLDTCTALHGTAMYRTLHSLIHLGIQTRGSKLGGQI
jgi:hypothetical protein